MERDVIAAISTPPGSGAVGIVRISGAGAKEVLSSVWISGQNKVENFITHRLYYGKLSTERSGGHHIIDNVLAVWMGAPHSYTGEDIVEIHCHGGGVSTRMVLEAVLGFGARLAEPGEFTRRAFMNGKLDLSQAEAVADIIGASSERALKLANEQLEGRLSRHINKVLSMLKGLKAFVEASIDFPEDDVELIKNENIADRLSPIIRELSQLASTYKEGRLIHDGVRVAIVGKPNVGKSSIMNALLGSSRAIVHHEPGTTRDTIEEPAIVNGVLFRLTDTAGLRDASCEVERIGVSRAREKIKGADLAMVVLDASKPLDKEDAAVMDETNDLEKIIVLNKIDLLRETDEETLDFDDSTKKVSTSTVTGVGIEELKAALVDAVGLNASLEGDGVHLTNIRHKRLIDEALASLANASRSMSLGESAEFVAHHLQSAMEHLGKITGEVTTEDVLNEIFSRFCIGK